MAEKKHCKDYIYFDNNAGTPTCDVAIKEVEDWMRCYNPSSDSRIAKPAKAKLQRVSNAILDHCGVSSASHTVVFTSGATESNCFIIKACVKAYKKKLQSTNSNLKPHIILSAIEHHSSMECVKDLYDIGDVDVSYIQPTIYGNILAEDVEKEIRTNTCLISIMYANNEIPVINNITEIGAVAHKSRIPLHSDCVQIFGKYQFNIIEHNIDALSASAHKFYGPKGVGILLISNLLIDGYKLTAEINGSQQHGLRGGTENVPLIAGMYKALEWSFSKRELKNIKLWKLRDRLLERLSKYFKFVDFTKYIYDEPESKTGGKPGSKSNNRQVVKKQVVKKPPAKSPAKSPAKQTTKSAKHTKAVAKQLDKQPIKQPIKQPAKPVKVLKVESESSSESLEEEKEPDVELISLGPTIDKLLFILPSTVLLAICKNKGKPFCNVELKKYLDDHGAVISIGSACMTASENASHVLSAIGAPPVVKRGVIRISFGDTSTMQEVDKFVTLFYQGIYKQVNAKY